MVADEQIEKLLKQFGQTMSDLPLSYKGWDYAYPHDVRKKAKETSYKWGDSVNKVDHQADYICHLEDVIDRMEIALRIASECIKSAHIRASLMSEGFKPLECWTYQSHPMYDLGYKDAGSAIAKLIDCYRVHEEGETNDGR